MFGSVNFYVVYGFYDKDSRYFGLFSEHGRAARRIKCAIKNHTEFVLVPRFSFQNYTSVLGAVTTGHNSFFHATVVFFYCKGLKTVLSAFFASGLASPSITVLVQSTGFYFVIRLSFILNRNY